VLLPACRGGSGGWGAWVPARVEGRGVVGAAALSGALSAAGTAGGGDAGAGGHAASG